MPDCPICPLPLEIRQQREGVYYVCTRCGGRALTIPQLRRVTEERVGLRLMRLLGLSRTRSARACPFCGQCMLRVVLPDPPLELEGCRACNAIWFDAPSYELLPEGFGVSTSALSLLATEIFAENKLKEQREREEREAAERKQKRKRRAG